VQAFFLLSLAPSVAPQLAPLVLSFALTSVVFSFAPFIILSLTQPTSSSRTPPSPWRRVGAASGRAARERAASARSACARASAAAGSAQY